MECTLGSVDISLRAQWFVKPCSARRAGAGVAIYVKSRSTQSEGGFTNHPKGSTGSDSGLRCDYLKDAGIPAQSRLATIAPG